MKAGLFIISFILLYSIVNEAQTHNHRPLKIRTEKSALALINALPEVQAFMKYARKSKPMLMVENDPDSTSKYYRVAMGVSNFDMFRTTDSYFVNADTGAIFISDNMDDSNDELYHLISLKQWGYWRKDPRFRHYHTIKNNKLIALNNKGQTIYDTKKNSRVNRR